MRSAVGRVLGLALVAVALMGVIGLAATQTFINKTGKTVTGIKVTFSKQVMITRHDSVFPDQSPNGRSQEFTFSGGELHNLGRFSISWLPSSANVTDYEWIEKAQQAQQSQAAPANSKQEFVLPDPNTPPILYGNDYPGPDEPLYQPQDDEQIWLTDLAGHGDIYDNDSIVINYAPGFDKSQITKIDVYRNGVFMRFLPEKFDVLTNAQMKTFDGNPAEHSPASNHTDHAIMGYEYKFEIHTTDSLSILSKTIKSGFRWHPKEVWAELQGNWIDAMPDGTYQEYVQSFEELKNDGFTGITFEIAYYMDTPYSNDIKILSSCDPSIIDACIFTPSNDDLETILKAITEAGLETHIRGYLYISNKYSTQHGFTWSSMITPTNPALFFDNYTNLLLELVPILNKYHVKLFTPFVEMDGIEKYSTLIKNMYDQIARVFTGELGFDEATHLMLVGSSPMQKGRTFEQMEKNFTFWDWEDANGEPMRIEYSTWDMKMETQTDQRVSVIERMFKQFWSRPISYYRSKYPMNPQMWGEIGAKDVDGYLLGADYYYSIPPNQMKSDEQERSDFMYAMLKDSKELGIEGINIWSVLLGDFVPNWRFGWALNIGLKQLISPAYRVVKAIIGPDMPSAN